MKGYRRFLIALVAGFAGTFALYCLAFWLQLGVPTNSSRWCHEVYEKKFKAASQITTPKLLIVGGSSVLFGIKAAEIQKTTGYPTINFGTHAALGPAYILRRAKQAAKPGDTVLLVLEYELYNYGPVEKTWANDIFTDFISARDPDYVASLSWREKWNLLWLMSSDRLKRGIKNRWHPEKPSAFVATYDPACVNDFGDQTGHPAATRLPDAKVPKPRSVLGRGLPESPKAFPIVAEFCNWAHSNQVRVIATFPNIRDCSDFHTPEPARVAERLNKFYADLNVPVVGTYSETVLSPEEFYDTIYHLNEESATARTQRLITRLLPFLKEQALAGEPAKASS